MSRIQVLDKSVAELIAAGEVVERPSSIVKELLENSIDAGATKITVEIQKGGIRYIRVTDDGCGIPREDIPNAFVRHATSKVLTAEDLSSIGTFGFRGEALASVAAMCKVELLSRTPDCPTGQKYCIEGGEEMENEEAGCPVGTTIVVRDIFYNTPARMKFLKKDSTEGLSVSHVVEKLALANPQVSIRFIRDGEVKLSTPGNGDALAAIHAALGREVASTMIPVDSTLGLIRVHGYISNPKASKATRGLQNFFVNSRFVRSKTCAAALEESYKSTIMIGKFPACVLNLVIPLDTVDVNVHPAKIEVRFSNEKAIFDTVLTACKDALAAYEKKTFGLNSPTKKTMSEFELRSFDHTQQQQRFSAAAYRELVQNSEPREERRESRWDRPAASAPRRAPEGSSFTIGEKHRTHAILSECEDQNPYRTRAEHADTAVTWTQPPEQPVIHHFEMPAGKPKQKEEELPLPADEELPPEQEALPAGEQEPAPARDPAENWVVEEDQPPEMRVVGEIFNTYILLEYGEKFIMVDKHAAHERYLYNILRSQTKDYDRQLLLEPIPVSLSRLEYAAAMEHLKEFEKVGIVVEDFGEGSLIVREAPTMVARDQLPGIVEEICGKLMESRQDLLPDQLNSLYQSIACRSAVKGGNRNSTMELAELVEVIRERDDIHYCPHGRPVLIEMTRYEIEKMFGRLG